MISAASSAERSASISRTALEASIAAVAAVVAAAAAATAAAWLLAARAAAAIWAWAAMWAACSIEARRACTQPSHGEGVGREKCTGRAGRVGVVRGGWACCGGGGERACLARS
eukprot:scaffold5982_cov36-Phaeocystis_antarctica.AAC.1